LFNKGAKTMTKAKKNPAAKKTPAPKKVAPKKATQAAKPDVVEEKGTAKDTGKTLAGHTIEKGVPMPEVATFGQSKYDFDVMEVGESAFFPVTVEGNYKNEQEKKRAYTEAVKRKRMALNSARRNAQKKLGDDYVFRVYPVEGGVRVWRIEPTKK
jgi:hypothetical protein